MKMKLLAVLLGALAVTGVQANDQTRISGETGSSVTVDPAGPNRSAGQTVDDATITSKVKAALIKDDLVKARNINVDTVRGVVKLSGTVANDAEKQQALRLAKQAGGVVDVQSNLSVGISQ